MVPFIFGHEQNQGESLTGILIHFHWQKKNPDEIIKFSTNLSRFITSMKSSISDLFDFTTHSREATKHISFSLENKTKNKLKIWRDWFLL